MRCKLPGRRLLGTVAIAACGLVVTPALAAGATFTLYGPPSAPAWGLAGHSVSGGAGTLPNDYPGPKPWDQPAGNYCAAYKFAQPSAPTTSAALAIASATDLASRTGFDPGLPREAYQMRHLAQPDSSACQAKGATWGFWANAATPNNFCASWCGVRHDWSTGMALGTRPWSNGYPAGVKLVLSSFRHVRSFSGVMGWSFMCAMLQDTTTSQRMEYCLRAWRSWTDTVYDPPIVFRDPQIGVAGTGFAAIVTDVTATGTPYAQNWGGTATVLKTQPSGNAYAGAITKAHLLNAVADTNARIKADNLGTCLGLLSGVRCYSVDPDKYALLGVEDGVEFRGAGTSHMGGYSSGLLVYTDF